MKSLTNSLNTQQFKIKQKRNKRTVYDRSQIDVAVDLVLKNKLSLRAASHIYKIPFSTLRTRKIFLEEHPEEELHVYPNSQSSTIQSPIHHSQQSTPPPQPVFQQQQQQQSPIKQQITDERLAAIQEMREKPLTLHNMKSLSNPSAKTEALIATLALKSNNQADIKNRIHKKTYLKKPLKKRLKDLQPHNKHKFLHAKNLKLLHFNNNNNQTAAAATNNQTTAIMGVNTNNTKPAKFYTTAKLNKMHFNNNNTNNHNSNINNINNNNNAQQQQIKKISKATLKNNEIILSSINANTRRTYEEAAHLQATNTTEHTRYAFKNCKFFKCKDCKLIFLDVKQLYEHQTEKCKQIELIHEDKLEKLENLSAYVDKQNKFKCSFCKNIYLNKFSFLSHAMVCNGVNNLL